MTVDRSAGPAPYPNGYAGLFIVLGLVIVLLIASGCALSAAAANAKPPVCSISITGPVAGANVARRGRAEGRANIPPGSHLWVFVHMQALDGQWWPQGVGPLMVRDRGDWYVMVNYGSAEDVGENFEVAAVAVEESTNRTLLDYVKHGQATGDYPPFGFPGSFVGCRPEIVVVTKASH